MTLDSPRDPLVVHAGRVLLLIDAFTGATAALDGLAKLARLDFLLRYPVYLEAVAEARGKPLAFDLRPTHHERLAPEGAGARWAYGPWDHRYRPVLARLVGQTLVSAQPTTKTLRLRTTKRGHGAAERLEGDEWQLVRGRARGVRRIANLNADNLTALVVPLLSASAADERP